MYVDQKDIRGIQLDHTSRCNLLCPQCARTNTTEINPNVVIKDLTVDNYKTIFEPLRKDVKILHCGNYGDVIASPTFDDTLDWCLSNDYKNIQIITNGSARKPEWWSNLAKNGIRVIFSVDGLKDTNHLYRVNSVFDNIIENITAYTSAGGEARWDYLVFEHNQHQIEDARNLAKLIGVTEFNVKYTSRFVITHDNAHVNTVTNKNKKELTDLKANHNVSDFTSIIQEYTSFEDYVKRTSVTCKYKAMSRYYVDMEMRVWPCCWMGSPVYTSNKKDPQYIDYVRVMDQFGKDFNRLDIHGWNGVLNSKYYQEFLENSWISGSADRLYTCGRTCGDKFQFSSGYGKNTSVEKLT